MVRHIVMWKFKANAEGAARSENLTRAKALLESLREKIPEIRYLQVGIDLCRTEASYDLVLTSEFADTEALRAYQRHPDHLRVVEFLRKVHEGRVVVDHII